MTALLRAVRAPEPWVDARVTARDAVTHDELMSITRRVLRDAREAGVWPSRRDYDCDLGGYLAMLDAITPRPAVQSRQLLPLAVSGEDVADVAKLAGLLPAEIAAALEGDG